LTAVPQLLVVDDNPADVMLVREALAGSAHHPEISNVEDGEEAWTFLNRGKKYMNALRPDLIILDLNLPKKHGQAVLADIKSTPDLCRIPVVIFSTSQARQDIVRSYELGANCYVSKPGNLTDFFSAIQSIEKFWFNFVNLPPRGE